MVNLRQKKKPQNDEEKIKQINAVIIPSILFTGKCM